MTSRKATMSVSKVWRLTGGPPSPRGPAGPAAPVGPYVWRIEKDRWIQKRLLMFPI